MKIKFITAAIAATLVAWAPNSMARQSIALPYFFGDAPGDIVGQETGIDSYRCWTVNDQTEYQY